MEFGSKAVWFDTWYRSRARKSTNSIPSIEWRMKQGQIHSSLDTWYRVGVLMGTTSISQFDTWYRVGARARPNSIPSIELERAQAPTQYLVLN